MSVYKDSIFGACMTHVHEIISILSTTANIVALVATVVENSWHRINPAYLKTCFLLKKCFLGANTANTVTCWLQNHS